MPVTSTPSAAELLESAVREAERHVAAAGWDQNARLFALVSNAELMEREPEVASSLGITDPVGWTPVEQEELSDEPLDDVLAALGWPAEVEGALVVMERVVLPPSVENTLPDDDDNLNRVAQIHPQRDDVRMAVGVLRDGTRWCILRLRTHDDDASLISGADVVPGLADALLATFSE